MAEAHETADSDQELKTEGEQREDQNLGRDLEQIGIAEQRQAGQEHDARPLRTGLRARIGLRLAMPTACVPPMISGRPKNP